MPEPEIQYMQQLHIQKQYKGLKLNAVSLDLVKIFSVKLHMNSRARGHHSYGVMYLLYDQFVGKG